MGSIGSNETRLDFVIIKVQQRVLLGIMKPVLNLDFVFIHIDRVKQSVLLGVMKQVLTWLSLTKTGSNNGFYWEL